MPKSKLLSSLAKYGGEQAHLERKLNLCISVEAEEKVGKTFFGLSAPGPIVLIAFDKRFHDTVLEFQDEKEIIIINPEIPYREIAGIRIDEYKTKGATAIPDDLLDTLVKEWMKVVNGIKTAVDSGARTIVIDTADEMLSFQRMARFGKLDKVMPKDYGMPNSEYEAMMRYVTTSPGTNLILLHKMKDEWKNEKKTGRRIRAGYKDIKNISDVNLRLEFSPETDEDFPAYKALFTSCGVNPLWTGQELVQQVPAQDGDAIISFPYIAALVTGDEVEDLEVAKVIAHEEMVEWEV